MHRWTIMAIAVLCAFTTQLHAADAVSGASPSEIRVGEVTRIGSPVVDFKRVQGLPSVDKVCRSSITQG